MDIYIYAMIPVAALIVDAIYGDPRSNWHPVVLIGKVISFWEKYLYPKSKISNYKVISLGFIEVLLVFLTIGVITGTLLFLAKLGGTILYFIVGTIIVYFTITPRSLTRDGMEIYHLLRHDDILTARQRLSWIVGRDTDKLQEDEIARGTIETIAENTTDGIISPLFYFIFFGPLGAMLYRAGNTMDSMLGYKNERYLYFGRVAARFDDVLNYIPARITYILFIIAALLLRLDWKNAISIGWRDAPKHPSPNGGYAEATVAGAMHVRLGGYNYYQGEKEFRAYMGEPDEIITAKHIKCCIELMYVATILFVVIESIILLVW